MLGNSGSNTNNSGSNSLASAMRDAVGSIGGIGNTSPLTSSDNWPEQQANSSSTSTSSQKGGGKSFGKALARGYWRVGER